MEKPKKRAPQQIADATGIPIHTVYYFLEKYKRPASLPCFIGARAQFAKWKNLKRIHSNKINRSLVDIRRKEKYRTCKEYRERVLLQNRNRTRDREKARARQARYIARQRDNPVWRIKVSMRARLRTALDRAFTRKSERTYKLIGCSPVALKQWLESHFDSGMSWENYGTEWHVDHRQPISSFDLKNPFHQKACFHYTNLYPLWAKENLSKGSKVLFPQMTLPV